MPTTIPQDDAGFDKVQKTITPTTETNMTLWNIDSTWYAAHITPKKKEWTAAYGDYIDPHTRTPNITFIKNERRGDYEPDFRQLVKMLVASPYVSPDALDLMGIAIPPDHHSNAPIALTFPAVKVDTSMIRELKLFFHDQESEHKAKPKGQHGAEVRWMLLETPPDSVNELTNSAFDTNSPLTLTFDDTQRGKTVYFCLRWENTRGEKGPWSGISSAIIP
ncbi:MAG: hypothetical protein LBS80_00665 [Tannerella sp.]|jgi:hypothetical protein|nr:hypothetical protein [Tannerella sp.]